MKCYSCKKDMPAGAGKCPSCGQAVYARYVSGAMSLGRRIDGCLPDKPSPKDFVAVPEVGTLPRKVDLRAHCSPIEDQGEVASCTANAAVGAMEFNQRKLGLPTVDLSRMFVYFNARQLRGQANVDSGAAISDAMAAFLAYGAPSETQWPYDPALFAQMPSRDAYAEGERNQPSEYARLTGLDGVQGALARQCPVVFGVHLPMRCFEEAGRTGLVPAPTDAEVEAEKQSSGHAMLLVGYDQGDKTYLVRNSWGTGWGDQGYCRMPMDVVAQTAHTSSLWILGKLEASGAFRLTKPQRTAPEGSVKDMAAKMRSEIRDSLTKDIKDSMKDIRDRLRPPGPRGGQ